MKKDSPRKISMHITVKDFFVAFWRTILIWCIIILFIVIALHFNMDKTVIGGIVVVFGIITQAFTGLIGIISLVAKILALPLFWLINALGYFVSILAIKKGFSKEVINYRILTIVLLVGIVIGFILGKII
jgi:hypothetical protein